MAEKIVKKEKARLDALKGEKKGSFFSDGLSSLRHRFGSHHANEEGDVEMVGFENPMRKIGTNKAVKKGNSRGEEEKETKETKDIVV